MLIDLEKIKFALKVAYYFYKYFSISLKRITTKIVKHFSW